MDPFPSADVGLALHARLLGQDATASCDVCEAFLPPLVAQLAAAFPGHHPHAYQTAAEDALLSLFAHPERFDPARADLTTYLRMAARRDLLNLVAKASRLAAHESAVEDPESCGNSCQDEPALLLINRENADDARRIIDAVRAVCS